MSVIISSGLVGSVDEVDTLDHPRILWNDVYRRGTITASSEVAGAEGVNVADGFTWDHWTPVTLPATVEVELDEAEAVDTALIAGHNLGTCGATIKFEYWNGSAWVDMSGVVLFGDNRVAMMMFEQQISNRYRAYITGAGAMPSIAIVMLGESLVMQRKIWRGHVPITMAKRTTILPTISESGQTLGRSIIRQGVAFNIEFANLRQQWIRDRFVPFMESARTWPFGWAWRPYSFPNEAGLVWIPDIDIHPIPTGPADLMSVAFSVQGKIE